MHIGFTPLHAMMQPRSCNRCTASIRKPMFEEKPMKRLVFLMLLSLFSASTLTACNTMAGVGEDVEAAGDKIESEAEGHLDCDTSDEC